VRDSMQSWLGVSCVHGFKLLVTRCLDSLRRRRRRPRPRPADETGRVEKVIAVARVFLAASALVAISFDTKPSISPALVYSLLLVYLVFAALALALPRLVTRVPRWLPFVAHAADLGLATAATLLTARPNGPAMFVFTIIAAAHRWGFRGSIVTAVIAIGLLLVESFVISVGMIPSLSAHDAQLNQLIMRASYMLLVGALVGYLGEKEQQRRWEASVITLVMARARMGAGLEETVRAVLAPLAEMFGSRQTLLVMHEKCGDRSVLWSALNGRDSNLTVTRTHVDASARESYLFDGPGDTWHASARPRAGAGVFDAVVAIGNSGTTRTRCTLPSAFLTRHPCRNVLSVSVAFEDWTGRVLWLDPEVGLDREGTIRFARRLIGDLGPSVYEVYRLRRLRSIAEARERVRIARELHDGVTQTLVSIEMQLDVLKRRAAMSTPPLARDLSKLQEALRTGITDLRGLMSGMRSATPVHPREPLQDMSHMVERFQRETGITAELVSDRRQVRLSPRAGHEVKQILRESLVNVLKHSGARHVFVRARTVNGDLKLSIEDDGRGFPFAGRLTQEELDARRQGPLVIKERARALGGHVTVESVPGQGARLEVALPLSRNQ
jgi:signal transduction histidine kinase